MTTPSVDGQGNWMFMTQCETLRGGRETLHGGHETLRGGHETLRGITDTLRGITDILHGITFKINFLKKRCFYINEHSVRKKGLINKIL